MIAILILAGLIIFYVTFYYLNHKTPVPEGCEDLKVDCDGCKVSSCGNHPVNQEIKKER
ncbi:MAG: hypothetical protein ACK5KQ_06100 [Anaerorhabdus sp.]